MRGTMLKRCVVGWVLGVLLIACTVTAWANTVRTWTSADGATLEAVFVDARHQQVVLERPDGQRMQIHLQSLSEDDRRHIQSLQAAAAAEAAAAAAAVAEAEQAKVAEAEAWAGMLGSHLVNARNNRSEPAELVGRKVGLYFSAQWCPPCRNFTPKLVEAYEAIKQSGEPFEIVFVSHDRSAQDMRKYMRDYKMPWLAVPYGADARDALKQTHGIRSIPSLVIVDANGKVLSRNAVAEVGTLGAAAFARW